MELITQRDYLERYWLRILPVLSDEPKSASDIAQMCGLTFNKTWITLKKAYYCNLVRTVIRRRDTRCGGYRLQELYYRPSQPLPDEDD